MNAHLRANLWLLALSVLLCSVLYPLALLGIGQTLFHDKAQGSLVTDSQGSPIGSGLIASPSPATNTSSPVLRPQLTTRPPRGLPTGRPAITCCEIAWPGSSGQS